MIFLGSQRVISAQSPGKLYFSTNSENIFETTLALESPIVVHSNPLNVSANFALSKSGNSATFWVVGASHLWNADGNKLLPACPALGAPVGFVMVDNTNRVFVSTNLGKDATWVFDISKGGLTQIDTPYTSGGMAVITNNATSVNLFYSSLYKSNPLNPTGSPVPALVMYTWDNKKTGTGSITEVKTIYSQTFNCSPQSATTLPPNMWPFGMCTYSSSNAAQPAASPDRLVLGWTDQTTQPGQKGYRAYVVDCKLDDVVNYDGKSAIVPVAGTTADLKGQLQTIFFVAATKTYYMGFYTGQQLRAATAKDVSGDKVISIDSGLSLADERVKSIQYVSP